MLLFDIDGTLVVTGGAGQRAMNRAFHDVFGIPDAFKGVDLAGRTDTSIVGDAFARQGMAADAPSTARFRERYLTCLQEEVPRPGAGKRVLPGITPLLEALEPDARNFLALLTGNYADAAAVKLGHFDLWRYFRCGAFGEDHGDRNHLVPVAMTRARDCGLPPHVESGPRDRHRRHATRHRLRARARRTMPGRGNRRLLGGCAAQRWRGRGLRRSQRHARGAARARAAVAPELKFVRDLRAVRAVLVTVERRASKWRKRLGVEPSLPDKREATDFEDREGHRAPFASVDGESRSRGSGRRIGARPRRDGGAGIARRG